MADFIMFDEGANEIWDTGLPATCSFDLSTKSVGGTSPFSASDTYSTRGVLTGATGYSAQPESQPTPASRQVVFAVKTWTTGSATDWSSAVRSCVICDAGATKAIAAWNLLTGGTARDMSQANTTENVTPTLGPLNNPA